MKKFAVIFGIILSSCGQAPKQQPKMSMFDSIIAEESTIDISMLDTVAVDSNSYKMTALLGSTENTHKALKEENKALKKELHKTKTELNDIKAALVDTIEGGN